MSRIFWARYDEGLMSSCEQTPSDTPLRVRLQTRWSCLRQGEIFGPPPGPSMNFPLPPQRASDQRNARRSALWLVASTLALGGFVLAPVAHAADPLPATPMQKTGTAFKADADMQAVLGVSSVDREVGGAVGNLPARIYTPAGAGPFPVVVYFHGGGWVIADKQVYDGGARALAKVAQAVVVSVDYRRAPEAKFPAAWDDALAAYKWVAVNAASLKGDSRRMALAGESAGANLALATAIAARDAKLQSPTHVLAVYPVGQTGNLDTASYKDSATAKPLNKAMVTWFVDKLLAKPDDKKDPRLDLVNARLAGLPPVTIINAQIDPLREDGALLEAALVDAPPRTQTSTHWRK